VNQDRMKTMMLGGLLGDSVMISDVISSRDEYDAVLGHGTDVRSQTFGFEASSDVLSDVLLDSYE
jgi:hypothetical protein